MEGGDVLQSSFLLSRSSTRLDKSFLNLLVVEFWRVALWMIRMEDSVGGMNVFSWILMLFLTLACIVYPAYRIQASLLFFEIVENPIF